MREGPAPFDPGLAPDQAWRWDGHMWVPVLAPEPRAGPATGPIRPSSNSQGTPLRPPQDSEPPPEAEPPRTDRTGEEEVSSRHGWPMVGALIGASLVALVAIVGVGMLTYRAAGSPPPNPQPATSGRPVDPNALGYRYLSGITVGGLTNALESDGFSCAAPSPPENHLRGWRCDRPRGTQHDVVQIWAVDGSHVHLVEVTTVAQAGPLEEPGALQLETRMAQLVYGGSTPGATAAINWVSANPTGDATTQVGEVTLRTERSNIATMLEFDAGSRG